MQLPQEVMDIKHNLPAFKEDLSAPICTETWEEVTAGCALMKSGNHPIPCIVRQKKVSRKSRPEYTPPGLISGVYEYVRLWGKRSR